MNCFRTLSALLIACTSLLAQTPLIGNVFDGSGGPLLTGVVYHATGSLTVPAGKTLTAQPGAIVKFNGAIFNVDGTLIANGTLANPVIFTSIHDDAAGGDTNGNGNSTTPAPDQWYGMAFSDPSDASKLTYTTVRYVGVGYSPAISLASADITATDCTFSDGNWGGIGLNNSSLPTLTRCKVVRVNSRPAIYGVRLDAVPNITDCTVSGNPGGSYLRIDATTLAKDCTYQANNCPGGSLVYSVSLNIGAGRTLTLGPGVVLKAQGGVQVVVAGTLNTNGTSSSPVYLTSLPDDAVGGDTNGDGNASSPAPDNWYGLSFLASSSASVLNFTTIRYTGLGYSPVVGLQAANITALDCTFSDGNWGGMDLGANSLPTIARCTFARIRSRPAIYGTTLDAVPGFTNVIVTNNPGGNYLRLDNLGLAADRTIQANNCPGGALAYSVSLGIGAGRTLTLGPGVVMKAIGGCQLQVAGTLLCNGTSANPVYLTSFPDDAAGGDTNGDGGATGPTPDNWYGIDFLASSGASVLNFTTIRYTGLGYSPVVNLQAANIKAFDCTFSDGNWGGIALNGNSNPTISRCTFARIHSRPAVYGAGFESVPGFTDNVANANNGGNFIRIDNATFSSAATIESRNCLGGALVCATSVTVAPAGTLSLRTGVVVKMPATALQVNGALNIDGPAVFTSYRDDSQGGDTNGDGPSAGAPDDWYGLAFGSTTKSSTVRRALVRYCGAGYTPAIQCSSSLVAFHGTRVEHGSHGGFLLSAAAFADDLIAYSCADFGIRLTGGNFLLRNATAVNNGGYGVQKSGAWTGTVQSTISYGNSSGGFGGFAANDVNYSNGSGFVAGNGNLSVDPQLVSAGSGDLRLQAGSPCIDTGDPLEAPFGLDALGVPRYLDGNLDLSQRIDMGANEFDNILFGAFGEQKPGKTLNFVVIGSPSINLVAMVFGSATPTGVPLQLPVWGSLYVDLFQPAAVITWPAPPSSVPVTIPVGLGVPANLVVQAVGLSGTSGRGNVSNPGFLTIR